MTKATTADALTPLSYEILLALSSEDLHGYGIIKDIEARSGAGSVPSTGALYLALQRLEEMGDIEEVDPPKGADARRRYYSLTPAGRLAAQSETERIARLVADAHARGLISKRLLPTG